MKRILVVEDESAICTICQRVLTKAGFEVDCATNGRIAQEMVEEKRYDFCLVDIRTPKMNGQEFYRWLQKKYARLCDHVIFTSGDVMAGDTQVFLAETARPFLPKPFTPEELEGIINKSLKEAEK